MIRQAEAQHPLEVDSLIELYFQLVDPLEREALLEKIAADDTPVGDAFLQAVMERDADANQRLQATVALAQRGDTEAQARLWQNLDVAVDAYVLHASMMALAEMGGLGLYPQFHAMWHDALRPTTVRRAALMAVEYLDAPATLAHVCDWLDTLVSNDAGLDTLADDIVEQALAALCRHNHAAAVPHIEALCQRLAPLAEADDGAYDILGMCRESIALIEI